MVKVKVLYFSFLLIIWGVDGWINPITFIYSVFGLRSPKSLDTYILTNLPDNPCSLSYGMEVAAWPPYSQQMFFLYYKTCDAILDRNIFRRKPYIRYDYAYEDHWYCVIIFDRDKKGLDNGEYFLHYLGCNIDGYDLKRGMMWDEFVLMRYIPPKPPQEDGYHRIVFAVYLQSDYLPEDISNIRSRDYFNIRIWMRRQPILFCGPIAAVQMQTNYL
ncbi:uncharacterized protein LOC142324568 [Lycorma delicatula]|uniref:uncharacterized protein LOC142324568 n=1 Tax=Lycorma delicatula TaxID=130591 RepID=UPI003F517B2E